MPHENCVWHLHSGQGTQWDFKEVIAVDLVSVLSPLWILSFSHLGLLQISLCSLEDCGRRCRCGMETSAFSLYLSHGHPCSWGSGQDSARWGDEVCICFASCLLHCPLALRLALGLSPSVGIPLLQSLICLGDAALCSSLSWGGLLLGLVPAGQGRPGPLLADLTVTGTPRSLGSTSRFWQTRASVVSPILRLGCVATVVPAL